MAVALFFGIVVLCSFSLVVYITLHGMRNKMLTPVFGVVLIVCASAACVWTMTMIFNKVPAMVSTS